MKSALTVSILALLAAWPLQSYAAPPETKIDDQGHVVLQTDDLNHKTIHTYSIDGERIKTEGDNGQRLNFDRSGQGKANPAVITKKDENQ